MAESLDQELKSDVVQVVPDLPLISHPSPPCLWKQLLGILVFLFGVALMAAALTHGMAWLFHMR